MKEELLTIGLPLLTAFVTAGIAFFWERIKLRLDEKWVEKIEKIASSVELAGNGLSASDKLKLFCDICKTKKINANKAVKYLEEHIIPVSNQINVFKTEKKETEEAEKEDEKGAY